MGEEIKSGMILKKIFKLFRKQPQHVGEQGWQAKIRFCLNRWIETESLNHRKIISDRNSPHTAAFALNTEESLIHIRGVLPRVAVLGNPQGSSSGEDLRPVTKIYLVLRISIQTNSVIDELSRRTCRNWNNQSVRLNTVIFIYFAMLSYRFELITSQGGCFQTYKNTKFQNL